MRRFLLLLLTLLTVGVSYATTADELKESTGLDVNKYYRFKNNKLSKYYLGVDPVTPALCGLADNSDDQNQIWKLEIDDEGTVHMCTLSGYYISGTSKETHTAVSQSEKSPVGFTKISDGIVSPWWGDAAGGGDAGHCYLMQDNGTLGNWGPWTAATQYVIEEAEDPAELAKYAHSYTKDQIITLSNKFNPLAYAYADTLGVKTDGLSEASYWQFIPTVGNETYYIKNRATGLFIKSCAGEDNYQQIVQTGTSGDPYIVLKGEKYEGSVALIPSTDAGAVFGEVYGLSLADDETNNVIAYDVRDGVDDASFWTLTAMTEAPVHPLEGKIYTIKNMNFDQWAADNDWTTNVLKTVTEIDESSQWEFIPTIKSDCYYVRNVATGRYAQSTKTAYNGKVLMGDDPVEYCVKSGAGYQGYYGLASTDQDVYDFSSSACVGWNLVQADQYVTGYNAQDGVNGKSFWKISPYSAAAHEFDANHIYAITNKNAATMYAQDSEEGLATGSLNEKSYWRFIPTENSNCYYIQNTKTGKYAQSSVAAYNLPNIPTGDTPVEYCILAATAFSGYYGLASTDQTKYDFTDASCIGWNMVGTGNAGITGYAAKDGTNGKSFWTIVKLDSIPVHPLAGQYTIKNKNFDQWVCDKGETADDGTTIIISSKEGIEDDCIWEFIPTIKSDCYYVKNVATGRYAQSTNRGQAYNLSVKMGDTPVEYCVKAATSFTGFYGIASTDQDDYGFASAECIGWNLAQSAYHVVGYSACDGTNGKSFWQLDKCGTSGEHYFADADYVTINSYVGEEYATDFGTQEDGQYVLETTTELTQRGVWKLEIADGDECYYLKNAATGRYIQSSAASFNVIVKLASEPVSFLLTSSGSYVGCYGICSTDQDIYDCTTTDCVGLNQTGQHTIVGYSAKDGTNKRSFWYVDAMSEDIFNSLPTGINDVKESIANTSVRKTLRGNQIVILKGDKTYNVGGMQLK